LITEFSNSLAFSNGEWMPLNRLSWSVTDIGTTHGAILVERFRTLGGKSFALPEHMDRLSDGIGKLGMEWSAIQSSMVEDTCRELLNRNAELVASVGDVGVVVVISPGDPGIDRRMDFEPTIMAHLNPIPFKQLAGWYKHGVALHISEVRNVPPECWSPSIKTRSRLQYWLADRHSKPSIAVLLGTRGTVTETSISNLLIVGNDGVLRSPPLNDILWGVSLKTVVSLAESIGVEVKYGDILPKMLQSANEILMTGSTGCLWSAISVDDVPIGDGKPGPLCRRLQLAWEELVGHRFTEVQA
jgi:branched-subunit amino acid aminotransferase/4-amino-4-deoxychorismate lyase